MRIGLGHLLIVEFVLAINNGKHFLVQDVEKCVHYFGEIRFAVRKVLLQLGEKIAKHVRVLLVDDTVRFLEHFVEVLFRSRQQVFEIFCKHQIGFKIRPNLGSR